MQYHRHRHHHQVRRVVVRFAEKFGDVKTFVLHGVVDRFARLVLIVLPYQKLVLRFLHTVQLTPEPARLALGAPQSHPAKTSDLLGGFCPC